MKHLCVIAVLCISMSISATSTEVPYIAYYDWGSISSNIRINENGDTLRDSTGAPSFWGDVKLVGKNGSLMTGVYCNSVREGFWLMYDSTRFCYRTVQYKHDQYHGEVVDYSRYGTKTVRTYRHDDLVDAKEYNPDGRLSGGPLNKLDLYIFAPIAGIYLDFPLGASLSICETWWHLPFPINRRYKWRHIYMRGYGELAQGGARATFGIGAASPKLCGVPTYFVEGSIARTWTSVNRNSHESVSAGRFLGGAQISISCYPVPLEFRGSAFHEFGPHAQPGWRGGFSIGFTPGMFWQFIKSFAGA